MLIGDGRKTNQKSKSMSTDAHPTVLVLDVGGTKLAAGILTTDDTLQQRGEVPTLAAEGAEAILG